MAKVTAEIMLLNPCKPELAGVQVDAVVDADVISLYIPASMQESLGLATIEEREVIFDDGKKAMVPFVGPLEIRFENRICFTGALVVGKKVRLGAIPLDDMDVVIAKEKKQLVANPDGPIYARGITL
jgi:hypothetical protein